ncbi:Tex family protein [Ureaplasma ceti]|uniref:Tex family protein n=1 Tax=Ureaplasma ceti TaxID=3119530 RepID=A0ABP9U5S6_9BACT
MTEQELILRTSKLLNLSEKQVTVTLSLLKDGATVPFISRYRKELTHNLNEDQVQAIYEVFQYQNNLQTRKEAILKALDTKGILTPELSQNINQAERLSELEAIYKPYKDNKKTRASMAIAKGLEPLAQWILHYDSKAGDLSIYAKKFLNAEVTSVQEAINGALDIIAQMVALNSQLRETLKTTITKYAVLETKLKPKAEDENETYKVYYDFRKKLTSLSSYQVMAINRGEKEKILAVKLNYKYDFCLAKAQRIFCRPFKHSINDYINQAIEDGFKRLLIPSIENAVMNEITEQAEEICVNRFGQNLQQLLLQAPIKNKNVLGWDPGFRTGCKLAVVLQNNEMQTVDVVYPFEKNHISADETVVNLITKYQIEIIAIGNGTASRESVDYISQLIKQYHLNVEYCVVSEAGASVYSASKIAQTEFPDLPLEKRSAISIARRIIDPLAELIKIPSLSIGVGQYQHDLPEKSLNNKIDYVVEKTVNLVGVDVNTASEILLTHISGLNASLAKNIVAYRNKQQKITTRQELSKIKGFSDQKFLLSAGFLRIVGSEPLDMTSIHPESYSVAYQLLNLLGLRIQDINTKAFKDSLKSVNPEVYLNTLKTDIFTLKDIIKALLEPLRDYRDSYDQPILRKDILKLEDLQVGTKLQGVVRNILEFGAFIDLGIKESGLLHVSQIPQLKANNNLTIYDVLEVGQIINVSVLSIDLKTRKIQLARD